ncbi:hypothetical protein MC7420_549 [Coleofasciculus chthonoplastes PCC 7420]|uniref:Uncharacterized protein n=1 Tax=Coleofasciculus chthonoplastes PCC 7420 TaxID=118168 RepID=B4VKT5_9CYAN|nr:hypothetical protein MC7420_549 [Coleofasciculus chthonoplastes PCC 7420]
MRQGVCNELWLTLLIVKVGKRTDKGEQYV